MPTVVSEPLNPPAWTTLQQQQIFDELAFILDVGIVPPNLDDLSDKEIHDLLHDVLDNIKSRKTSEQSLLLLTEFEGDEIYESENVALNSIQGALKSG